MCSAQRHSPLRRTQTDESLDVTGRDSPSTVTCSSTRYAYDRHVVRQEAHLGGVLIERVALELPCAFLRQLRHGTAVDGGHALCADDDAAIIRHLGRAPGVLVRHRIPEPVLEVQQLPFVLRCMLRHSPAPACGGPVPPLFLSVPAGSVPFATREPPTTNDCSTAAQSGLQSR